MAEAATEAKEVKKVAKKVRKSIPEANVYVIASYNNTIMSLTDPQGNVIAQSSAGANGFKGSRKSTPYAATVSAEKLMEKSGSLRRPKGESFYQRRWNGARTGSAWPSSSRLGAFGHF